MGHFLRPKDTNLDRTNKHINAEQTTVPDAKENEYIPTSGFDSDTDGLSGAIHRKDPVRREAAPNAPLPTGSWRSASSRNVASGFGRGTRAGRSGRSR